MKKNGTSASKPAKDPAFVTRAERALRRAAENVKTQNRACKLPLILWQNGKVVQKPAGPARMCANPPPNEASPLWRRCPA